MHPCIRASSPSLARAHKLVASQHSPCSTFEPRHPCLGYANLQQRQRRLRRGISATLLVLSSLKYLKSLQTYTSFPGTGGTVTVENRAEFCSRQIRHFLRPCRSDVFVERPGMGSQQLPCLTASSPSLARARKHVAAQLSPCHRIACAKGTPQLMGHIMATQISSIKKRTLRCVSC